MSRTDRRISEWLFLLSFATYAWFHAGGGWNQNAFLDTTRAIVERHTFAIDSYAVNTGDVSFAGSHIYANKSPALSWLAAIVYWPLHALEQARGLDAGDPNVLTLNAYLCTLLVVALPAALVPALCCTRWRAVAASARGGVRSSRLPSHWRRSSFPSPRSS